MGGFFVKGEGYVALLAGRIIPIGITQLKVFGTAHFDNGDYDFGSGFGTYETSFLRWQIGLSKGFYLTRNVSLAPFVSYGAESATSDDYFGDVDTKVNTYFLGYGASVSMNLTYWAQLMVGLNMYSLVGNAVDQDGNDWGDIYTYYFDGREGMSIDVGLRIEF
jgi:hypothetical protein